jgi:hypothetical protein
MLSRHCRHYRTYLVFQTCVPATAATVTCIHPAAVANAYVDTPASCPSNRPSCLHCCCSRCCTHRCCCRCHCRCFRQRNTITRTRVAFDLRIAFKPRAGCAVCCVLISSLDVSQNALSGPVPPGLSVLTALTSLQLNNNQFAGTIPSDFSRLTGLVHMDVSWSLMSGSLPSTLSTLTRLTYGLSVMTPWFVLSCRHISYDVL